MPPEPSSHPLSSLVLLAAEQLAANGYRVVRDTAESTFPGDAALLAEDDYSVLAIVAFETWTQLEAEWPDAQAQLVDLLSRRLARSAPKAWDGYLLLLCGAPPLSPEAVAVIERDTNRLRKIVAPADRLRTTGDLTRFLEIFFPLSAPPEGTTYTDVLEALPDVVDSVASASALRVVIEAFRTMEPPLDRLHQWRHS